MRSVRRSRVGWETALLGMLCAPVFARQAAPPVAVQELGGAVTGHVVCGDTQRVARFATVGLVRKLSPEEQKSPEPAQASTGPGTAETHGQASLPQTPTTTVAMTVRTAVDGSFHFADVQPGDYYVVGWLPGYVLPLVKAAHGNMPGADRFAVMAKFPLVHVGAGRTASADLRLERGGVVAGRITFDDGSPVTNAAVDVMGEDGRPPDIQNVPIGLMSLGILNQNVHTDDEGRYRVAGLAPGKYIVETVVEAVQSMRMVGDMGSTNGTGTDSQLLRVYAPGTLHRKGAAVVEVRGGEVRTDVDVEVDVNGLRSVRGRVLAAGDHPPEGFTMLDMTDAADEAFTLDAPVAADGSFHIDFVPPGTYKLTVYGQPKDPQTSQDPPAADGAGSQTETTETEDPLPELLSVPVLVGEHDVALGDLLASQPKAGKSGPETTNSPK